MSKTEGKDSSDDPMDFSQSTNSPLDYVLEHHDKNTAFVIHRNNNKNVVVYSGNLVADASGVKQISSSDPLNVYWVLFEKEGHPTEGLNLIERNTAYGIDTKLVKCKDGTERWEVYLEALKGQVLTLMYDPETESVYVTCMKNDVKCVLKRVFVNIKMKWGFPKVNYIEIYAVDPDGNEVIERMKP